MAEEELSTQELFDRGRACFEAGEAAYHRRELEQATQYLAVAIQAFSQLTGTDEILARCLINLANCLDQWGQLTDAEQYYRQALTLFEGLEGSQASRAGCIMNLAVCIRQQGRLAEAEEQYRQALTLVEGMEGVQAVRAHCTMNLAVCINEQGRLAEAEALYLHALTLYDDVEGAQVDCALCTMNLAICIYEQGRLVEAEALYLHALTLYDDVEGAQADRARCTTNLATCIYEQGRLADAEEHYRKALTLFDCVEGAQADRARCTMNLAICISDQGQLADAEEHYRQALTLYKGLEGVQASRALCTMNLAVCLEDQGTLSVESREELLSNSRLVFTELKLTAKLHQLNHLEAGLIERQAHTTTDPLEQKQLLERALALAVLAAFDADVRRYQFDTESKRLTWMETTAEPRIRLALRLAAATDNAALISDLIGIWRTAGTLSHDAETHTVTAEQSSSQQTDTALDIALTDAAFSGNPAPWGPSLTAGSEFAGFETRREHQLKRKPAPTLLMPHHTRPAAAEYTNKTEPTSTHYR